MTNIYPWQKQGTRSDVTKVINTDIEEPLYIKVSWVSREKNMTKRAVVEAALREYLPKQLTEFGVPPDAIRE
jgi:Ser-tRNA(Ala) deacylase AlaX